MFRPPNDFLAYSVSTVLDPLTCPSKPFSAEPGSNTSSGFWAH